MLFSIESKWLLVIGMGISLLFVLLVTKDNLTPSVAPPHKHFVLKHQKLLDKISREATTPSLEKILPVSQFTGWNNVSQGKTLWKPSHLTPAAFRDFVHWEPGLKFHQPCKHTQTYPCCQYAPSEGNSLRKLHFVSNSSNLSMNTLVREFYQKAQNKKILFVGDSLMLYLFDSVADFLNCGPVHIIPVPKKQGSGQKVYIQTFMNAIWNFSSTNIYHYVMSDTGACEKDREHSLSWEMLQQYVDQSDVIVFNMGLHYLYSNCPKQTNIKTISKVARILQLELKRKPQKQVIFRSTLPQHFPGNDGYFAKTQTPQYTKFGCAKFTTNREHESNDLLKFVAEKYKFKYMDSFPIYMERWDLHWKPTSFGDCTHSCITAEMSVPELALLNSLLNWHELSICWFFLLKYWPQNISPCKKKRQDILKGTRKTIYGQCVQVNITQEFVRQTDNFLEKEEPVNEILFLQGCKELTLYHAAFHTQMMHMEETNDQNTSKAWESNHNKKGTEWEEMCSKTNSFSHLARRWHQSRRVRPWFPGSLTGWN